MFRTVSVHLQEQSFCKLLCRIWYMPVPYVWLLCCYINTIAGICRYHTFGYCVAIATQQPNVSAYTSIYQIRHTAYKKIAPEDGLIQSETCKAYIEK